MIISGRERLFEEWAIAWTYPSPSKEEQLISLLTDDCVYEDVALGVINHGKEEVRNFYQSISHTSPDLEIELKAHFVTDRYAAAQWVMYGTYTGEFPGLPPVASKPYSIRGATIIELQGNKIKHLSDFWDMAAFLKQLDVMPST